MVMAREVLLLDGALAHGMGELLNGCTKAQSIKSEEQENTFPLKKGSVSSESNLKNTFPPTKLASNGRRNFQRPPSI